MGTRANATEIEAEIERTRRELDRTLNTLGTVMSAGRLLEHGYELFKEAGPDKISHLAEAFFSRLRPEMPSPPPTPAEEETLAADQPEYVKQTGQASARTKVIGLREVLVVGGLVVVLYFSLSRLRRS